MFLLQAAVLAVLLGFVPTLDRIPPVLLAAEGNLLFGSPGSERWVRFEGVTADRADRADLRMVGFHGSEAQHRWRAVYSTRPRAFWPAVVLLSLLVVTPMAPGRRAWVLPAALGLQNAALLAHVGVVAWVAFQATDPRTASAGWTRAVDLARASFNSPVVPFAIVFVIWALLARPDRAIDLGPTNVLLQRALGRRAGGRGQ